MGAIYIPKQNATFIHIPRTGGQSTRKWIMEYDKNAKIMPLDKRDINVKHPDIWTAKKYFGHDLGFTFCTVRNPYDRLVSMWGHLKKRDSDMDSNMSFKKFVLEYADYTTFMKPISCWFGPNDIDYIIRFENLNEDFKFIQNRFKTKKILIRKNGSKHEAYTTYYDNELIEFVAKKFKDDLERFNYVF